MRLLLPLYGTQGQANGRARMEVDEFYKVIAAACVYDEETLYFIELKGMKFVRDTGDHLWFEQTYLQHNTYDRPYAIERRSIIQVSPD
jgi:hypothetical protein